MKSIQKLLISTFGVIILLTSVSAHVEVSPDKVGVASEQIFSISVPNEKEIPMVAVKLIIPDGVNDVTPSIKSGWKIEVKKDSDKSDARVTELNWTGGNIPAEQREDFSFSAQVPAKETNLIWKAYQTYQDGSVVAWDQDPGKMQENKDAEGNPYSQTKIVNDLTSSTNLNNDNRPLYFSIAALILAALAFVMALRNSNTVKSNN